MVRKRLERITVKLTEEQSQGFDTLTETSDTNRQKIVNDMINKVLPGELAILTHLLDHPVLHKKVLPDVEETAQKYNLSVEDTEKLRTTYLRAFVHTMRHGTAIEKLVIEHTPLAVLTPIADFAGLPLYLSAENLDQGATA